MEWLASRGVILLVPILSVAALYASSYLYRRSRPTTVRRVRTKAEEFKLATSLLDTHGNIVTPWRPNPQPGGEMSGYQGWLNLCLVWVIIYTFSNGIYNWRQGGSWFRDSFLFNVAYYLPELARDWTILGAVYMTFTFGFVLLTLPSSISPTPVISSPTITTAFLWFAEICFILGCVIYSLTKPEWPTTQRAAWLLETVVLLMKMHSYISVNRLLHMEVQCGGPGTGAVIFNLDYEGFQIMKKERRLPPQTSEPTINTGVAAAGSHDTDSSDANRAHTPTTPTRRGDGLRRRQRSGSRTPTPKNTQTNAINAPAAQQATSVTTQPTAAPTASGIQQAIQGLPGEFAHVNTGDSSNATSLYHSHQHITYLGAPDNTADNNKKADNTVETTATRGGGDRRGGKAWQSVVYWEERASQARDLIGKVLYGVNYEGQLTTTGVVAFPNNVNLKDFLLFSFAPVLCYEPNYPRTQRIRLGYLAEKTFLAAGFIVAGIYIHTTYVLPVIADIAVISEVDAALQLIGPLTALLMIFFFLIFECILNAFAELTCFGDRSFYGEWWNATTFLEWNRQWNVPVHTFLLRHVYLDSMRTYGLSGNMALYLTFAVSIVLHELVVYGITGPTMPWLGLFSLIQLPLATIQRISVIKGKRLGNYILWAGLAVGITLIIVLYSKDYCKHNQESCRHN